MANHYTKEDLHNTFTMYRAFTDSIGKEDKKNIKFDLFKSVLSSFNKNIVKEILKGYTFTPCWELGNISIIKRFRGLDNTIEDRIDFNASKKLRQQLIDEGKTIYKQWIDEKGNKVNNGGHKYIVRFSHQEHYFRWLWKFSRSSTKNILAYKFIPTRENQLGVAANVNSLNHLPYTDHRKIKKNKDLIECLRKSQPDIL